MEPVTKERLARYISLKKENENRLERLARMKSNAEMPAQRDPDGSKHTGSSGERMARAIEAYMEYEEQIGPLVETNRREMAEIEAAVAALPDPLEREVLRLRYLRPSLTWEPEETGCPGLTLALSIGCQDDGNPHLCKA